MAKYKELKEMLCEELDTITRKGELSPGSLEIIDKLTHSIKSLDTIIAMEDAGYSGYNARRDNMGRYSRDSFKDELHKLLEKAPDEHHRKAIKRMIEDME